MFVPDEPALIDFVETDGGAHSHTHLFAVGSAGLVLRLKAGT
jgi:hypothetical protein